jgi:hypothetical protein
MSVFNSDILLDGLHSDCQDLMDTWLTDNKSCCAANQPVAELCTIMEDAWHELRSAAPSCAQSFEEYLRSQIVESSSERVSMFLPFLLQAVAARLDGWEAAGKFLPHVRVNCSISRMCLSILQPVKLPEEAAGVDFGWPRTGNYARYAPFWDWKPGRRSSRWVADVLEASLHVVRGLVAREEFVDQWVSNKLPDVGKRAWNLLSAGARLSLLRFDAYESILEWNFQRQLSDGFTRSRKSLGQYLGISSTPRLANIYDTINLLSRFKFDELHKMLGHQRRQWDAIGDSELEEYIAIKRWNFESNFKEMLSVARPEARVWLRIVRGDTNVLKDLNLLPQSSFKRIIAKESSRVGYALLEPVSVNGAEIVRAFLIRLIRTGFTSDLLGGALDMESSSQGVRRIFLELWPKWRPRVSVQFLNKQLFRHCNDDFTSSFISHPEGCRHVIRMLRALPVEEMLKKISEVEAEKILPCFFTHGWSMSKPLLRRIFEHADYYDLGLNRNESVAEFWTGNKIRFARLMEALSGHLTVGRARSLLNEWIDRIDSRNARKLLALKLKTGRKLGSYVLRWSLGDKALEDILAMGGVFWSEKLFHRDPVRHFPVFFKQAGLRRVLPYALRDRKLGEMVDQVVPAAELLKHMEWVRRYHSKKPTAALAFETALLVGIRHAPYLHYLAIHRYRESRSAGEGRSFDSLYREHRMRKRRGGGIRVLRIPDRGLKYLQRKLLDRAFSKMDLPEAVHGFRRGHNLVTNATPHAGKEIVVNADIRDFFPNTSRNAVFLVSLGLAGGMISAQAAGFVADICCQDGVLPTGSPSSPVIANLVLSRVDKSLQSACDAKGVSYTRYADDLTFSGGFEAVRMLGFATRLLEQEGYNIHPRKVNIFRRGRRQMVTGLAVNERPTLPRAIRRGIRAVVHAAANGRHVNWKGVEASPQVVHGLIAHLAMTRPEEARSHRKTLRDTGYFKGRVA